MKFTKVLLPIIVFIMFIFIVSPIVAIQGSPDGARTSGGTTIRVSVSSFGLEANAESLDNPVLSPEGRYVVFTSRASNLIGDGVDANNVADVFLHDLITNETRIISVSSLNLQGIYASENPRCISSDAHFVPFQTENAFVPDDTNGLYDVYVRDTVSQTTERVSIASNGSQGNGRSLFPCITPDGRYITFVSEASNLVGDDTNGVQDAFMHDRLTGTTTRLSFSSDGVQGNAFSNSPVVSSDGRYAAFSAGASNLVDFDTNRQRDVFVRDTLLKKTTRVSVNDSGVQGNGNSGGFISISFDGRFVAFGSTASNLVDNDNNGWEDVFVHDRDIDNDGIFDEPGAIRTERVSVSSLGQESNYMSGIPTISMSGRYVSFWSEASNLVVGDSNGKQDVFIYDRVTNEISRVTVSSSGEQGNNHSAPSGMAANGRFVGFSSTASNLVTGDNNGVGDSFVHDLGANHVDGLPTTPTATATPTPTATATATATATPTSTATATPTSTATATPTSTATATPTPTATATPTPTATATPTPTATVTPVLFQHVFYMPIINSSKE